MLLSIVFASLITSRWNGNMRLVRRAALLADKTKSYGKGEVFNNLKTYEDLLRRNEFIISADIFEFAMGMVKLCTALLSEVDGVSRFAF